VCIVSNKSIVSDKFMESFSAHGGLVHVTLSVAKITERGVGILVENSPKLKELLIVLPLGGGFDVLTYQIILEKTHNYQKLTAIGYFKVRKITLLGCVNLYIQYHAFNNSMFQNSDLFSLF